MTNVKIVVTAETAQAAAALRDFVAQSNSGLKTLEQAGAGAGNALTELRHGSMAAHEGFRTMESAVFLLGGSRFPQLSMAVMGVTQGMRSLRSVALLTGASLGTVLPIVGALAVAIGAGALVWHEFSAAEEEASKRAKEIEENYSGVVKVLKELQTLHSAGLLGSAAASRYADYLTGKKKLYKDSHGNLTENPTEEVELSGGGMMGGMGMTVTPGRQTIERNLPEATQGEIQNWVKDQATAGGQVTAEQAANIQKTRELEHEAHVLSLDEIEQKIVKNHDEFQKKRDELIQLNQEAYAHVGDVNFATDSSVQGLKTALADLDTAEAKKKSEIEQKAVADRDKAWFKAFDLEMKADDDRWKIYNKNAEKERADAAKKLADLQKELELKQTIARAETEAQLKAIEGNPLLTNEQKAQQSIPWLQAALVQNAGAQSDMLAESNNPANPERLKAQDDYNKAVERGVELQNQLNAAAGHNSFGYQFSLAVVQLRNMNNLAYETAQLFDTTINGAISSISSNLTKVVMGTQTWRAALYNIETSVLTGIVQGFIQIGTRMIIMEGVALVMKALNLSTGTEKPDPASEVAWGGAAMLRAIADLGPIAGPVAFAAELAIGAAAGGTIASRDFGGPGEAGMPYFIGRGAQPELFVPDTAGHFYPRNQLASMRGADGANGAAGESQVLPPKVLIVYSRQDLINELKKSDYAHITVAHVVANKIKIGIPT